MNISLNSLRKQFEENGHPERLVDQKISQIKNRGFTPLPKNTEPPNFEKSYTITLPFTSRRCENISIQIMRAIRAVTPEYRINFAWKLLKLGQAVTPNLKPNEPLNNTINLVYGFKCFCDDEYIGETSRRFTTRTKEHGRPSSKTAVSQHIHKCESFLEQREQFLSSYSYIHKIQIIINTNGNNISFH